MAPRYTNKDKTKYLNRVKKLLAEGKTINGACTQISEREEGRPSTHTLSLWVKAAGLTGDDGNADSNNSNTSSNSTGEKTTSRTKRRSTNRRSKSAESSAETVTPAEPVQEPEDTAAAPTDDTSATATATDTSSATEDSTTAAEDAMTTDSAAPTAELIHIPSTTDGSKADSSLDLDDLIDENHRLRSALNEANRELRGLRDLVGVYVSR